jgi:hypothetical protein
MTPIGVGDSSPGADPRLVDLIGDAERSHIRD